MIQGLARAIAIDYPSQSKRRLELGLGESQHILVSIDAGIYNMQRRDA